MFRHICCHQHCFTRIYITRINYIIVAILWTKIKRRVFSQNKKTILSYPHKEATVSTLATTKPCYFFSLRHIGAAPTTTPFSTWYLASMDWVKTTAKWDEKHLSFGNCVAYIRYLTVIIERGRTWFSNRHPSTSHAASGLLCFVVAGERQYPFLLGKAPFTLTRF